MAAKPEPKGTRLRGQKTRKQRPRIFKGKVYIIKDRCKGCGFCIECCPKKMLKPSQELNEKGYYYPVVIDEAGCTNCKSCEDICPEFAIFITPGEKIAPGV